MFSTIATYQTLNNVDRLQKFDPGSFDLVIVDEAHHCAALSYVSTVRLFRRRLTRAATSGYCTTSTRVSICHPSWRR